MGRFLSILFWAVVFLLIVLAVDQLLVRMPTSFPAPVAIFYHDLRSRVVALAKGAKAIPAPATGDVPAKTAPAASPAKRSPGSVEAVIEQQRAQSSPAAVPETHRPAPKAPAPRYVYADSRGELHFADTLAEIPEAYRTKAKILGE